MKRTFPQVSQVNSFARFPLLLRRSDDSLMEEGQGADCEAANAEERVRLEAISYLDKNFPR
jgi:hypothetical protein